jgi:hypothetical protein
MIFLYKITNYLDFVPPISFLNEGKNAKAMCINGNKSHPRPAKNGMTKEHVRILRNARAFLKCTHVLKNTHAFLKCTCVLRKAHPFMFLSMSLRGKLSGDSGFPNL